ncbi:MAG: Co2+/Mg2+ efflux protein ApaG [Saprospiraceae bacterium]|nr:Co2+/Mg2+ efflux protein ApaG [Saprospiraceae bacterium]
MNTQITHGIKISVVAAFQAQHSNPIENKYLFSYQIEIENLSDKPVQLLRRNWIIFSSNGTRKMVSGDGVVGQQPYIQPGHMHQYGSWCPLSTAIGRMYGTYEMLIVGTDQQIEVDIPAFDLVAPFTYN